MRAWGVGVDEMSPQRLKYLITKIYIWGHFLYFTARPGLCSSVSVSVCMCIQYIEYVYRVCMYEVKGERHKSTIQPEICTF